MAPSTLKPLDQLDPVEAWKRWEPTDKDPFNQKWAGHLYRRAAFGATLAEMRAAEKRGLPATLDLLLKGEPDDKDHIRVEDGRESLNEALLVLGKNDYKPDFFGRFDAHHLRGQWLKGM